VVELSTAIEEKTVTCIVCPSGCVVRVVLKGGKIAGISGNMCRKGTDYAKTEVINPMRILTTTVRMEDNRLLPVKTERPLPKALIFDAMKELSHVRVKAPVKIGQVVYPNVADTGVNVVATRSWK